MHMLSAVSDSRLEAALALFELLFGVIRFAPNRLWLLCSLFANFFRGCILVFR